MLTSRLITPQPANPEAEDIFSSSLSTLFTDDIQNSHGVPGGSVIYTSPTYGVLTLRIPAHPDVEESRRLFAHHLWNASIIATDLIETASSTTTDDAQNSKPNPFNMRGKTLLELGAGTALPSLISALSGAEHVTVTDHPESPSITTSAIATNMHMNLISAARKSSTSIQIAGYVWGTPTLYSASQYGVPLPSLSDVRYSRILMCDCLWMRSQHQNLVDSCVRWLSASADSCAIVIAGFHTGRSVVSDFFSVAAGGDDADGGGPLAIGEIYEIDVDGQRRGWAKERANETKEQAKRWCVVAILQRR
jgi:EEF1A N-terminal glycine/lysine methyltransferase